MPTITEEEIVGLMLKGFDASMAYLRDEPFHRDVENLGLPFVLVQPTDGGILMSGVESHLKDEQTAMNRLACTVLPEKRGIAVPSMNVDLYRRSGSFSPLVVLASENGQVGGIVGDPKKYELVFVAGHQTSSLGLVENLHGLTGQAIGCGGWNLDYVLSAVYAQAFGRVDALRGRIMGFQADLERIHRAMPYGGMDPSPTHR